MNLNRRHLIKGVLTASATAALPGAASGQFLNAPRHGLPGTLQERYAKLDAILKQPVFKRELFKDPVILESVELLHYKNSWICRVRSKDGHEGISVSNAQQMQIFYPVLVKRMAPFFVGKDARDLEDLVEAVTVYESNYKAQSLPIWVPLATIEFAILDMFEKMSNRSIGLLISDKIYNSKINVYQANGERDNSAEEVIE